MQLTNQEIAKVFAMYLGCDVKVNAAHFTANNNSKNIKGKTILSPSIIADCHERTFQYSDFKLLLTPLSKIADEDAVHVAKMIGASYRNDNDDVNWNAYFTKKSFVNYLISNLKNDEDMYYAKGIIYVYQYLISRSYDVQLWLGIDHPANGKTAIELGIAIDKTTI